MKNFNTLILFISIISLSSCNKDTISENDIDDDFSTYNLLGKGSVQGNMINESENQIFIQVNQNNNLPNGGGASFNASQNQISNLVNIDATTVDFTNDKPLLNIGQNINPELLSVLDSGDRKITTKVNGESHTNTVYNPKPVQVQNLNSAFLEISISGGLVLNWDVDKDNPLNQVAISLINRGDLLNITEEYEPVAKDSDISIIVNDSGQYTISPESISEANFDLNDIIYIYIGRANVGMVDKTAIIYYNTNLLAGKVVK